MQLMGNILNFYYRVSRWFELAVPAVNLATRLFIANVFFKSGLVKIMTWESTLYLFHDEYHVPLLPPDVAAYLATAGELGLSVLLVFGLFGRFAAAGLFILNVVAAYSYYDQLSDAGRNQHLYWGIMITLLLVYGMGSWSADQWIEKRVKK